MEILLPPPELRYGELRDAREQLIPSAFLRFRPDLCRHLGCDHPGALCDRVALIDEEAVTDYAGQFQVQDLGPKVVYIVEVVRPGEKVRAFRLEPLPVTPSQLRLYLRE